MARGCVYAVKEVMVMDDEDGMRDARDESVDEVMRVRMDDGGIAEAGILVVNVDVVMVIVMVADDDDEVVMVTCDVHDVTVMVVMDVSDSGMQEVVIVHGGDDDVTLAMVIHVSHNVAVTVTGCGHDVVTVTYIVRDVVTLTAPEVTLNQDVGDVMAVV